MQALDEEYLKVDVQFGASQVVRKAMPLDGLTSPRGKVNVQRRKS